MNDAPSDLTLAVARQLRAIMDETPSQKSLEAAFRLLAKWRAQLIDNTIVKRSGKMVLGGPFAGMDYSVGVTEGAGPPRRLGCYEAVLIPVIETIIARAYPLVVDIGAADGYYAVGLARRMPGTRVLARDTNLAAQAACRTLAAINGVADRVDVGGEVSHSDFDLCNKTESLVICDIEGAEDALLDPARAPGLLDADILVEVHDCFALGLSSRIAARFAATHRVTRLDRRIDGGALPSWMEELSDLDRLIALWEWRAGPTPWLWIERHERP